MGNTYSWNGGTGDFSVAANWTDTSSSAPGPPTAADVAELSGNGGTLTGTGTASLLQVGGSGPWTLAGDFVLAGQPESSPPPFAFMVHHSATHASGTTIDAAGGQVAVDSLHSVTLDVLSGATAVVDESSIVGWLPGDQGLAGCRRRGLVGCHFIQLLAL